MPSSVAPYSKANNRRIRSEQATNRTTSKSGQQGRAQENIGPSIVAPNSKANNPRFLPRRQATNQATSTSGGQDRAQEIIVPSIETPERVANRLQASYPNLEASPNGQATTRNPSASSGHGTAQDDNVPSMDAQSPVTNNPQASYPNLEASASRQATARTTPFTTRNTPGLRLSPLSGFNASQSTPAAVETNQRSFHPTEDDDLDMTSDRSPTGSFHDTDPEEYDKRGELLLTYARYQEQMHGTSEIKVVAWRKMGYGKQVSTSSVDYAF